MWTKPLRLLQRREEEQENAAPVEPAAQGLDEVPLWERLLEKWRRCPDEVLDRIPTDSWAELDHYLYGVPKRPTP